MFIKEKVLTDEGIPDDKDSLGRLKYRVVEDADVATRRNYQRGSVIDYLDGDQESEIVYDYERTTFDQ